MHSLTSASGRASTYRVNKLRVCAQTSTVVLCEAQACAIAAVRGTIRAGQQHGPVHTMVAATGPARRKHAHVPPISWPIPTRALPAANRAWRKRASGLVAAAPALPTAAPSPLGAARPRPQNASRGRPRSSTRMPHRRHPCVHLTGLAGVDGRGVVGRRCCIARAAVACRTGHCPRRAAGRNGGAPGTAAQRTLTCPWHPRPHGPCPSRTERGPSACGNCGEIAAAPARAWPAAGPGSRQRLDCDATVTRHKATMRGRAGPSSTSPRWHGA
mgnify:CR=1 FL=1